MYEMYGVVDVLTVLLLSGEIVNRLKYDAKNSIHIYIYRKRERDRERERQRESYWHHILTRLTRNRSLPKFTGWAIIEARSIRRRLRTFRISREQKTRVTLSIIDMDFLYQLNLRLHHYPQFLFNVKKTDFQDFQKLTSL